MAKLTTTPFTQNIRNDFIALSSGDGFIPDIATIGLSPTNVILLTSGAPDGSIVKNISVSSNDSTSDDISFFISNDGGSTDYLLGTFRVTASGGFNGTTATKDILNSIPGLPFDNSGKRVLPMPSGTQLYVGVNVELTSAISPNKNIYINAQIEDF
jgi:hypothetical protein